MSQQQKNILIYSFSGFVLLGFIVFGTVKNNLRRVKEIEVNITHDNGNYFTDQGEVVDLMTDKSGDYVQNIKVKELNHKVLEHRVESNPFIRDAQVYRDLKGNIQVEVEQSRPIARLFLGGKNDKYIDADGNILPTIAKHTARVPIWEMERKLMWEKNLNENKFGKQVMELLLFIEQDAFWKAQIAHVIMKKNGDFEFYTQVSKQKVSFGKPEDLEKKFKKLMTFYKEILPKKGWNTYSSVNLKFKNQIICQ